MRIVLLCLALLGSFLSFGQRDCATHTYIETIKAADPAVANSITAAEAFSPHNLSTAKLTGSVAEKLIRIPVVVHVLYNTAVQNISDAQIKSQIEALNRDFRRRNSDSANTPARFKSIAADVQIEFVLASADPNGAPTTGIVRKATSVKEWTNDDKIKYANQGGDNAWDSKSYLNIWVGEMHRLLGYSSAPGGLAEKDGIVISPSAFGTMNVKSPYDMGRTAVHEVGHWLGLKHIWGDTYCGEDGIDDTPKQGNYTSGCPNGFRSSCSNGELGDMYMNYMDFTYDACTNLFTNGQKVKMRSLFAAGGPRASLLESKGLNTPWNFTIAAPVVVKTESSRIAAYPNPASSFLMVNTGTDAYWIGKELRILNISGALLQRVTITSKMQKVDVSVLHSGVYMIQGEAGDQKLSQTFIKL